MRLFYPRGVGRLLFVLLPTVLALALALSSPANAQSASPGASQYEGQADAAAASAAQFPPEAADDVAVGTGAVNEAMSGGSPSAAASPGNGITRLPETGGAPLASLCAGASSLAFALLLLRSTLRKP